MNAESNSKNAESKPPVIGASGWSTFNLKKDKDAKDAFATYFSEHQFLCRGNPELDRISSASVLVTPGTTQDRIVRACLTWMAENWAERGPFALSWFTPGTLVAASLRKFREPDSEEVGRPNSVPPHLRRKAAELFLFPGPVHPDVESVTGHVPEEFAKNLRRQFRYSILSSYSFDLARGVAYFHFDEELGIQRGCANLPAREKFMFLAPGKFSDIDGDPAYSVQDLLNSSEQVTIVTMSSNQDRMIKDNFEKLCNAVIGSKASHKGLALCIVAPTGKDATMLRASDIVGVSND